MFPNAKKLRPPKGMGWASGFSEYQIDGEVNRFRYVAEGGWKVADGPGTGPHGERRVIARIGNCLCLFEELSNRPLSDRSVKRPGT
jgi:hypothetical protein